MKSAYEAACGKLSCRMRTEKEIRDFLAGAGYETDEIAEAVEELKGFGYIDDAKFCEEYFKYGKRKSKADARIIRELSLKGISPEFAQNVIAAARNNPETEFEDDGKMAERLALKMAQAQLGEGKNADEKFYARVARRLSAQGFSAGIIYGVLSELRTKIKDDYEETYDSHE